MGDVTTVTCSISLGRVTRRVLQLHKPIMSSAATTSKKSEDEIKPTEPPKEGDGIPHLSVLEEDDEFEEFPVQGEHPMLRPVLDTLRGHSVLFSSAC